MVLCCEAPELPAFGFFTEDLRFDLDGPTLLTNEKGFLLCRTGALTMLCWKLPTVYTVPDDIMEKRFMCGDLGPTSSLSDLRSMRPISPFWASVITLALMVCSCRKVSPRMSSPKLPSDSLSLIVDSVSLFRNF